MKKMCNNFASTHIIVHSVHGTDSIETQKKLLRNVVFMCNFVLKTLIKTLAHALIKVTCTPLKH